MSSIARTTETRDGGSTANHRFEVGLGPAKDELAALTIHIKTNAAFVRKDEWFLLSRATKLMFFYGSAPSLRDAAGANCGRTSGRRGAPFVLGNRKDLPNSFDESLCFEGGIMRCNIFALTLTAGLLWGAAMLIVASANQIWPDYGRAFLDLAASIYPGYHPGAGVGSVITGTLYGLADGAISGAVFGWLYNLLAQQRSGTAA